MTQPILHKNLPVIEVSDQLTLNDLYADPRTAQFLLARLGPTMAVVAQGQMDALLARLLKLGHTPRVLEA